MAALWGGGEVPVEEVIFFIGIFSVSVGGDDPTATVVVVFVVCDLLLLLSSCLAEIVIAFSQLLFSFSTFSSFFDVFCITKSHLNLFSLLFLEGETHLLLLNSFDCWCFDETLEFFIIFCCGVVLLVWGEVEDSEDFEDDEELNDDFSNEELSIKGSSIKSFTSRSEESFESLCSDCLLSLVFLLVEDFLSSALLPIKF